MKKTVFPGLYLLLASTSAVAQQTGAPSSPPQQSPGDFSLPPAPTPTPSDVQGPVDPDRPYATRPRAPTQTPTPAPSPTPTPTPRATPSAAPARSPVAPTGTSLPPRFTPARSPAPGDDAGLGSDSASGDSATLPPDNDDTGGGATGPIASPPPAGESAPPQTTGTGRAWLYGLLAIAALAAIAGLAFFLRRRRTAEPAPEIERPVVARPAPGPVTPTEPAPSAPPAAIRPRATPPAIDVRPLSLSRSMMNATLAFELVVTNRGAHRIEGVALEADMVSAHGREPAERQLADPAAPLAVLENTGPIDAGESRTIRGEVRLPVQQIRPLGTARERPYVPLLRLRALVEGAAPVARTYVVGKVAPSQRTRVMPFQLADMPQVHTDIGLKPLD